MNILNIVIMTSVLCHLTACGCLCPFIVGCTTSVDMCCCVCIVFYNTHTAVRPAYLFAIYRLDIRYKRKKEYNNAYFFLFTLHQLICFRSRSKLEMLPEDSECLLFSDTIEKNTYLIAFVIINS